MAPKGSKFSARERALGWLTWREYAAGELTERLLRTGFSRDEVEQLVFDLQQQGLQSDDRFAEVFCRHRVGQSFGPARIRAEMRSRGVEATLVDHHLKQIETDWFELATELCRRRYGAGISSSISGPTALRNNTKVKSSVPIRELKTTSRRM